MEVNLFSVVFHYFFVVVAVVNLHPKKFSFLIFRKSEMDGGGRQRDRL